MKKVPVIVVVEVSLDLELLLEVGLELLVDVINDRPVGVLFVHLITKTYSVNDCQLQTDVCFLFLGLFDLSFSEINWSSPNTRCFYS